MAQKIYSSRLLIQQAAKALDQKDPNRIALAAMAKKSENEMKITDSGDG